MSWRAENDDRMEPLDGLLEEFFRQELGRQLPPLPPSARPTARSRVRPVQYLAFGALLAACIACLMFTVYRSTRPRPPRSQMQPGAQRSLAADRDRQVRPPAKPHYVLFDEPASYDVRRVSSDGGELVIRHRSAWRHLVWQEPEVDTTIWMAFPVVDIEWSVAQADTDASGTDGQGSPR